MSFAVIFVFSPFLLIFCLLFVLKEWFCLRALFETYGWWAVGWQIWCYWSNLVFPREDGLVLAFIDKFQVWLPILVFLEHAICWQLMSWFFCLWVERHSMTDWLWDGYRLCAALHYAWVNLDWMSLFRRFQRQVCHNTSWMQS